MDVQWKWWAVSVGVVVHVVVSTCVFHVIYSVQPTVFIDEAFHVPQAQRYCAGNYSEWDSKITTLPGLYLLSLGCLGYVSGLHNPVCTVYTLRLVNLLFSFSLPVIFYSILKIVNSDRGVSERQYLVESISLSMFPLLYTFVFLYYTDLVSCVCVLLMYSLYLHKYAATSAVVGLIAVVVRQNNVVFVAAVGAMSVFDCLLALMHTKMPHSKKKTHDVTSLRIFKDIRHFLMYHGKRDVLHLAEIIGEAFSTGLLHFFVCGAFLAFVTFNGSVVVGDKTAHQMSTNVAQIVYFSVVSAPFLSTNFLCQWKQVVAVVRRGVVPSCLLCVMCVLLLEVGANNGAHPYLLADNRHVAFYLWRRLLSPGGLRLLMVPVASLTILYLYVCLRSRPVHVQFVLVGACVLLVCTSGLLELRYFILPFLLLRLQCAVSGVRAAILELAVFAGVNALTLTVFSLKTFTWSDQPGLQRIIW